MTDADSSPTSASSPGAAPLTYRDAGVDIAAADAFVGRLRDLAAGTFTGNVHPLPGGFAGLYRLGPPDTPHDRGEMLVACTDGVGTKLRVAFAMDKHDTIGIDLVAMNVNDAIVCGAKPLFFLDYLACGKLEPAVMLQVVSGIAHGCREAGCALIGGETSEMPDSYPAGEYDLAGFCVGLVAAERLLDGSAVRAGDVLLGLRASGLHSNGYTLARRALLERAGWSLDSHVADLGRTVGEELLEPTRLYVRAVRAVLDSDSGHAVHAMANITGGGLVDNVPRVLPAGLVARIDTASWQPNAVFDLVARGGNVPREEMWHVFNMGIGYVAIVDAARADDVQAAFTAAGESVVRLGEVEPSPAGPDAAARVVLV